MGNNIFLEEKQAAPIEVTNSLMREVFDGFEVITASERKQLDGIDGKCKAIVDLFNENAPNGDGPALDMQQQHAEMLAALKDGRPMPIAFTIEQFRESRRIRCRAIAEYAAAETAPVVRIHVAAKARLLSRVRTMIEELAKRKPSAMEDTDRKRAILSAVEEKLARVTRGNRGEGQYVPPGGCWLLNVFYLNK